MSEGESAHVADPQEKPLPAFQTLSVSNDTRGSSGELGSNPWDDAGPAEESLKLTGSPLAQPQPVSPFVSGALSPPKPLHADSDLLNEFDPLANAQEMGAKEAWETAESHPPPAPIPVPSPEPSPSAVLEHHRQTPSSTTFPSLASLARTFSIPTIPRRPMSLEVAKAVPSPATLSSMATQQQDSPVSPPPPELKPAQSGDARMMESPRPGTDYRAKDKSPPVFDFQSFLDEMKLKSAEPIARYLRSFLSNFAKRTFTVNDQVKIINDFLNFISGRMREIDIWRDASDVEFDNAMEGMEKLVMNRLYDFTFTPQVVRAIPPRPVTADDLERDRVLSQRVALFTWIEEKHLDIPDGEGNKGFLMFAQQGNGVIQSTCATNDLWCQELLKINHYKAPRDKLICILNCCKVIFGLIRHLKSDEGADAFVPVLIFVVLKANPGHLLSNVEFINRFRNPDKLQSEAGYYLSSLMGAVSFIETMDHTSLSNITREEFEKNVEEAIQHLPPSQPQSPRLSPTELSQPSTPRRSQQPSLPPLNSQLPSSPHAGEESAQPLTLSTPGPSDNARRLLQKTGDTISRPLTAIKQIFNEALDGAEGTLTYLPGPFTPFEIGRENRQDRQQPNEANGTWPHGAEPAPQTPISVNEGGQQVNSYGAPLQTPYKPRVRRVPSPGSVGSGSYQFSPENTPSRQGPGPFTHQPLALGPSNVLVPPRVETLTRGSSPPHVSRTATPALDFAGMQAEIDHAHDQAAEASKATLRQIFPGMEADVLQLVLEANEGDLGKSIEALLEMSGGT